MKIEPIRTRGRSQLFRELSLKTRRLQTAVTRLRERLKEAAAAQTAYEECKTERDALAAELADLYPALSNTRR